MFTAIVTTDKGTYVFNHREKDFPNGYNQTDFADAALDLLLCDDPNAMDAKVSNVEIKEW